MNQTYSSVSETLHFSLRTLCISEYASVDFGSEYCRERVVFSLFLFVVVVVVVVVVVFLLFNIHLSVDVGLNALCTHLLQIYIFLKCAIVKARIQKKFMKKKFLCLWWWSPAYCLCSLESDASVSSKTSNAYMCVFFQKFFSSLSDKNDDEKLHKKIHKKAIKSEEKHQQQMKWKEKINNKTGEYLRS